ncbi:plasmid partitioning protein RepB C-terminal domain-containing protein [Phyllobacterium sp. 22552]|uniref:plasmid partitioning protein RepB C-terminal domain-containing protein n=1 Tax=Phyllobacterium sp. 22552 TaxID=3453941 RepID=UPI003F838E3A
MGDEKTSHKPKSVKQGFEKDCMLVKIDQLLPRRAATKALKSSKKYRQIAISISEVGLVEPPVIARNRNDPRQYFILDGHLRIEVLKDMGRDEVECLVSTDDEAFTYNKQVSRIASIQEYAMIVNALKQGVPEAKIASVFSLSVESIRRRARMLRGICAEVTELLKDKNCPMTVFEILKKLQPIRQIEAAELMMNANNYSVGYASAILAGTPQSQLAEPNKVKAIKGISVDAIARMEKELGRLQQSMHSIQGSYGKDHLELTVTKGYLKRLLENSRIVNYLMTRRPEYITEFRSIVDLASTDQSEN